MSFSNNRFDPETLALFNRVFEEAWGELQQKATDGLLESEDIAVIRGKLALHIWIAAEDGVRDPEQLKRRAIFDPLAACVLARDVDRPATASSDRRRAAVRPYRIVAPGPAVARPPKSQPEVSTSGPVGVSTLCRVRSHAGTVRAVWQAYSCAWISSILWSPSRAYGSRMLRSANGCALRAN